MKGLRAIQGFTLIELLIVTAIIAIIAAIAVPSYQNYSKKARFSEVIQSTAPFKLAVENCYQSQGSPATVANCANLSNGVPAAAAISNTNSALSAIAVAGNGTITATASSNFGLSAETYILTPTPVSAAGGGTILIWAQSGTCAAAGYC